MYSLEELESHLQNSPSRPSGTQSMSPLRLASYLKNPRAESADVVLIEMREAGQLLAYRTLLPDHFITRQGQKVRFAWLSGNWVHPHYRRKGWSTSLLQSLEKAWEGRLMYTNYAPASKAVYDRSGSFREVFLREGKRYYLRAASEELLGKRMGGSRFLRKMDGFTNRIREGKLERFRQDISPGCHIEPLDGFDEESRKYISELQEDSLFQRDTEVFNWAINYPWITDKEAPSVDYHFSYLARRFENHLLKFRQPDTGNLGLLWMVLHNHVLSTPYVFAENGSLYPHMTAYILKTMLDTGVSHATLRNQQLSDGLLSYKRQFLHIRNMPQRIYAHVKLADQIPLDKSLQDGDGDVMFTG